MILHFYVELVIQRAVFLAFQQPTYGDIVTSWGDDVVLVLRFSGLHVLWRSILYRDRYFRYEYEVPFFWHFPYSFPCFAHVQRGTHERAHYIFGW